MATIATATSAEPYTIRNAPFPSPTKHLTRRILSHNTTATRTSFADKIFVTVTQSGRLAHWVHVPLDLPPTPADSFLASTSTSASHEAFAASDTEEDERVGQDESLLPHHHLTATTILGGTHAELDVLGQTLATQLASAIRARDGRETRTVVLGTGLDKELSKDREAFAQLVGLVLDVL